MIKKRVSSLLLIYYYSLLLTKYLNHFINDDLEGSLNLLC